MTGSARKPDHHRVRRRIAALIFGVNDMRAVEATAEYLLDTGFEYLIKTGEHVAGPHVRRTLEAGLVVVYARPFTATRGLPRLSPPSYESEALRSFHETILEQRDSVYAHTDESNFRIVLDLEDPAWLERFMASGAKDFAETWSPPTKRTLPFFIDLAAANRESFVAEMDRLHQRMRADS
jgi:hypothetical protein